jgi:ubiquinol-cytochrome c reductase cytochrome c1 subunit
MMIFGTLFTVSIYVKRFKWAGVKNRKLFYNPPKEH